MILVINKRKYKHLGSIIDNKNWIINTNKYIVSTFEKALLPLKMIANNYNILFYFFTNV